MGNKSLLPSGVLKAEGTFGVGETVSIVTKSGVEIGKGLSSFSSADIDKVKGKKTSEAKKILNNEDLEEVVHHDNLVLTD